jgi:hypothetical protein
MQALIKPLDFPQPKIKIASQISKNFGILSLGNFSSYF